MALYRRKESAVWWMSYTDAAGQRRRETTGTENKQLAQELFDRTKHEVWEQKRLGIKPEHKFSEAVELFLADKRKEKLKSIEDYEQRSQFWLQEFKGLNVSQITQELVVNTIKKLEDRLGPATRNRYLATLRATLRLVCIKYKWIKRDNLPDFFLYEEPKGRTRWLEPDEIARLLDALPPHWKDIAAFSFATGLRQSNVLGLTWQQVSLTRRTLFVDAEKMKGGKDLGIPLNEAAIEVLRRKIGEHHTYVFTHKGKRINQCSSDMWKRALRRAGITDFRPHDMRHTWASMLAQRGVPDSVLQKLGAWETPRMVDRYRHHSLESLAPYASKVDEVLVSQFRPQESRSELKAVS